MEAFAFELKLIDNVTATSKKAAKAVEAVEASAKKAHKALDFGGELEKAEHQLKRLKFDPAGYKKLIHAQKELSEQRKKLGKESFLEAFSNKLSFSRMFSAAFLGDLMAESMIEGVHKAVEVFADGIKEAFGAVAHEKTFSLGEKLSLGKEGGKEFKEDVERFSNITGFNPGEIRAAMLPLRRAGFGAQSSRQAFATATDIAAAQGRGGDMGAISSVLESFQRIKTKGGIGSRQLIELLGASGDTIPEFYKALGKKLKVSAKTAEKMAEEGGQVDPQLLMNMITASVNKKQGGAAGTGGAEFGKTLEGQAHKLRGLPDRYLEKLADLPGFDKISDRMGEIVKSLDPDSEHGKRIMASLERLVSSILSLFEKLTGNPEKIEHAVVGIAGLVDKIVSAGEKAYNLFNKPEKIVSNIKEANAINPNNREELEKRAGVGWMWRKLDKLTNGAIGLDPQQQAKILELQHSMPSTSTAPAAAGGKAKTVTMNVTHNTVIHGVDEDTGKKAGADVHQNMVSAHERAAQEGG